MIEQITLGDIAVDVVLKDIKHVHLSVYPPTGRVRVSAPLRTKMEAIRAFVISKLDWIKRQQGRVQNQEREPQREYVDRESHHLWGRRYLLKVVEEHGAASVELTHRQLVLRVRPETHRVEKRAIMEAWYRYQMRDAVPPLIAKWQRLMDVKVDRFFIRGMKTRWGSCTPDKNSIRLNTELAKKPPECLEYVLVHEMAHLLEPSHNARFVRHMDRFLPQWRKYREQLRQLPVRHEGWEQS